MPKKQPKQEPSKFKEALTVTLSNDGWVLPESKAIEVLDAHIRRLEEEIETLSGARVGKRIDPLAKPIPS